MVKWLSKNQDKIALIIGMLLIAVIAFCGGFLMNKKDQSQPLVVQEADDQRNELLVFLDYQANGLVSGKTKPEATIKLGEEVIKGNSDGTFQFDGKITNNSLTLYTEKNLIKINLPVLKIGEVLNATDSSSQIDKVAVEQVTSQAQNYGKVINITPKTGQFVASKNSNKYHLATCRFAKNIKVENKVWFASSEEAEKRGYSPCGTCIKK